MPPSTPTPSVLWTLRNRRFSALKANSSFVKALLDHGVSLERAANKWFSYFAWLVVLENWSKIRKVTA